ncbi:MAG: hypothetical protein AB1486_11300 [Planctomycetota bacterium]
MIAFQVVNALLVAFLAQDPIPPGPDGFVEVLVPSKPEKVELRLTSEVPASVVESRRVALTQGTHRMRFDWSRERIDENSVRFEVIPVNGTAPITSRAKIHRLGRMLYFDVECSADTEAVVKSRYLLAGIGWRVDYDAILDEGVAGEAVSAEAVSAEAGAAGSGGTPPSLALRLSVEINNTSGMDLANVDCVFEGGRVEALTLPDGERRRVEVLRLEKIPLTKRYIYDPSRFGGTPGIELEVRNSPEGPLTRALLPAGKIRVFGRKGPVEGGPGDGGAGFGGAAERVQGELVSGELGLLGEDVFPGTPLGEKGRFTIGHARDLVVERIVLQQVNENERRDRWNKVVAYDQRAKVQFKIRSGFAAPTTLTVVERPGTPFEIVACSAPFEKKKADTVEITVALEPQKETLVDLEWLRKNLF